MTAALTETKASGQVKIRMESSGLGAEEPTTVIKVFKATVDKYGTKDALKTKANGEWKTYTWSQYYEACQKFAKSLISLGMEPFKAVNVIGFNSPEWFIANNGAIMAGGLSAGIYTTNTPEACEFIAKHSEGVVVVCDGVLQLKKFVEIAGNLKDLKALVVYNVTQVPQDLSCKIPIHTFDDFQKLGQNVSDADLQSRIDAQKPGNCCTLIYTSGTTGNPKGVMISHDNATWTAKNSSQAFGGLTPDDRFLSYLPLSHIAAQMLDIHGPMMCGATVFFAQPDALKGSLGASLKECRPTIFFGVPRVWEKIAEKMQALGRQTQGLKKKIATWAKQKGSAKSDLAQYGNSGGAPCGYGCAHKIVLSKIHDALGLSECRAAFTGAAPIARETLDYFASLDIPVYELFGQSECTGPQTMNIPGKWKIGTAGCAISSTEMKIVRETQELCYKGRNIMMGYLKEDGKTKETVDDEGYLHSGDCAKIDDDGFMSITGRIKELIITAGGENIPPVIIEEKIKENTKALSNVMVVGDKRKFLAALYCLRVKMDDDGNPLDELDEQALLVAKDIGSAATTVTQAKACDKFTEYFNTTLKLANENATSRAQNVQKWVILDKDFTIPGGELTPTLKLKRRVVDEKYSAVIEELYNASGAPAPSAMTGKDKKASNRA